MSNWQKKYQYFYKKQRKYVDKIAWIVDNNNRYVGNNIVGNSYVGN